VPTSWNELRRALGARTPVRVADDSAQRAAVALILRDGTAGIELLFVRRAEHPQDPWSGQMAFPGGRREPEDAELRVTAVRETAEEIGVDLASGAELLGALDELRAVARMRPLDLVISPFVFRLAGAGALRLGEEVVSAHWLALDELLGDARRSWLDYPHGSETLRFPCLRFEDLVIWGLTYRMFSSLSERLGPALGTPVDASRP
jgi:8-oxo-dGTP pyrophosphatase MutT (NUDIX family)